jgi:ADP-heptose:LPS heptosyltransferase
MSRVLVIRLSALGDVAMLMPVLYSAAKYYPDDEFVLLTKSPLSDIFDRHPENVRVIPVFTQGIHKGIKGLIRIIKELSPEKINQIADIHDLLRSQQIRRYFRLKGKTVKVIDKGRNEKKALTRKRNKAFRPLKTSIERYHDVFKALGYDFPIDFRSVFDAEKQDLSLIEAFAGKKKGVWIGIAPFAKHTGKMYPPEKMKIVLKALAEWPQTAIFLFGGGKWEEKQLKLWSEDYPNVRSVAGQFPISSELLLMSQMDVMLTMDSGNMHLASLVGTPVISIWGATHPYAGFYGYNQDPGNAIQADLKCRPCSIFGDKPCYRKDYACMQLIEPEMIIQRFKNCRASL